MSLDQHTQAEAFVEFARKQEARIGGDRGAAELDAKLRVEREANWAGFGVTHWMMPSAPARHPRRPHFSRALSDYGPVDSAPKRKCGLRNLHVSRGAASLEQSCNFPAATRV
jgi:hypothetical protein